MRLESALLRLPGVRHGFYGREGGVSQGDFAGLNVGLKYAKERDNALANRARIAADLGVTPPMPLVARQVHGTHCHVASTPFAPDAPIEADALATDVPGLALGVTTADCVPVLFADPEARVIAAAHAGWKGALNGVLEATLAAMAGLGAAPIRVRTAIGPCIRAAGYEVGPEFETRYLDADPASAPRFAPGPSNRRRFDLSGYVQDRLRRAGIAWIDDLDEDTLGQPGRFFSYRRATLEGGRPNGLQLSAILLAD